jgi:hypothetical protein
MLGNYGLHIYMKVYLLVLPKWMGMRREVKRLRECFKVILSASIGSRQRNS